jgi:hypothetical protein
MPKKLKIFYRVAYMSKRLQNFKYGSNNGTQSSPRSSASAASAASRSALLLIFLSARTIGVFTVDSNGSLRGRLRKQLRFFCCMRFRFEKATQTDFNFDRTEFQTVFKAAELEFTTKSGNWQY